MRRQTRARSFLFLSAHNLARLVDIKQWRAFCLLAARQAGRPAGDQLDTSLLLLVAARRAIVETPESRGAKRRQAKQAFLFVGRQLILIRRIL